MTLNKAIQKSVAILCVGIVVAYASFVWIPHTHEYMGRDCAVCAVIEVTCRGWIGPVLSALVYALTNCTAVLFRFHSYPISHRDGTPVGQKVKLSD